MSFGDGLAYSITRRLENSEIILTDSEAYVFGRALEFVRVRKCDDDFARARRQQLFLSGLKSKLVSPWTAWKAPWKGAAAVDAISTDMGVGDLAKFGWLQWRLSQDPGDRYVLAGTPEYIGGTSYVIYDPTQGDEQIRRFLAS